MVIRARDLVDLSKIPPAKRPFLWCKKCGKRESAHAGDWGHVPQGHVFKCCKGNMSLARTYHGVRVVTADGRELPRIYEREDNGSDDEG